MALEVIVARSHVVDGEFVAKPSMRALATELGVAKDNAARPVGLLPHRRVANVRQARGQRGRAGFGTYAMASEIPALVTAKAAKSLPTRTRALVRAAATSQLSLLETS